MKKILISIALILPFFAHSQEKLHLSVNPEVRYQTIDGFGASDAWRCQFVGKNWPLEKRKRIADWLFSSKLDKYGNPQGIGLSIWRFYLAAGTAEQGEQSGIGDPWRRGESFLSPEGVWDWSKYEGQRWFLKAAKERGVPKFLAFTIAPPVQWSGNGKGFATKGNNKFNIKPGKTAEYAAYLGEVVDHFKKKEGVEFNYLSPFNEPQWGWEQGGQEGTPAGNDELYLFLKQVSGELSRRGLKTSIVPGEAGTIRHIYKIVDNDNRDNQMEAFFSPSSRYYIGNLPNMAPIISSHSYFTVWPVSDQIKIRKELAEKMHEINPRVGYWQSEYCILEKNDEIGQGAKRDLGMATALYVARIIHNDLTICQARSWQWWTALTESDYKDGLIYLDNGTEHQEGQMGTDIKTLEFDGTPRDSKLMWALGNFSRFIRPGMVRIDAKLVTSSSPTDSTEALMVSAYTDPTRKHTVVVCVNTSEKNYLLDLSATKSGSKMDSYVTNEEKNLRHEKVRSEKVHIPPKSVVTLSL